MKSSNPAGETRKSLGTDHEIAFFNRVLPAWGQSDVAPLLDYIRSEQPLTPKIRSVIAGIIETLDLRTKPRKAGTPGGKHLRWTIPEYVAVFYVDRYMDRWRSENGKTRVPEKIKDTFIDAALRKMKHSAMLKGKPPISRERVVTLLREPKSRRL